MPVYKCKMDFLGVKHGWSESWWNNNTSLDYLNVMAELETLARKRAALLGEQCQIEALTVSKEDEKGDGMLKYVSLPGVLQKPAAEPDVAVLVTVRNDISKRRKHTFLRGVWDEIETRNGAYLRNTAGWKEAMADYLKTLAATGADKVQWGWFGVASKITQALIGYTVDANNLITFETAAGMFADVAAGEHIQVRIAGVNGKSSMNGVYSVTRIDNTHVRTWQPYRTVPYKFGGTLTRNTPGFIKIAFADDQKVTTRKVGAPLLASHGHRKALPHA